MVDALKKSKAKYVIAIDPIELACVIIEAAAQVKRPVGSTAHEAFFGLDKQDQDKWLRTAHAVLQWWGDSIDSANRTS